jgi:hypothetical protein
VAGFSLSRSAPAANLREDLFPTGPKRPLILSAQAELIDYLVILLDIAPLEVIKQLAPPRDHLEQADARIIVLFMDLEMLGQLVDPLREQRYLHLRRTGVRRVRLVI